MQYALLTLKFWRNLQITKCRYARKSKLLGAGTAVLCCIRQCGDDLILESLVWGFYSLVPCTYCGQERGSLNSGTEFCV